MKISVDNVNARVSAYYGVRKSEKDIDSIRRAITALVKSDEIKNKGTGNLKKNRRKRRSKTVAIQIVDVIARIVSFSK